MAAASAARRLGSQGFDWFKGAVLCRNGQLEHRAHYILYTTVYPPRVGCSPSLRTHAFNQRRNSNPRSSVDVASVQLRLDDHWHHTACVCIHGYFRSEGHTTAQIQTNVEPSPLRAESDVAAATVRCYFCVLFLLFSHSLQTLRPRFNVS